MLPTGGAARFRGGLSVLDFVKIITVQQALARGPAPDCAGVTRWPKPKACRRTPNRFA